MSETVLVVGAGIGGLCTALALSPTGRSIIILERDGDPPSGDLDEAFRDWQRSGVGHLRQSHAFLARLRTIIKKQHPKLLDELLSLGVRELPFENLLTPLQRTGYVAEPSDEELTIITSRRTTLELAMRRYVDSLENVEIRSNMPVWRLIAKKDAYGTLDVTGVEAGDRESPQHISADVVIDASGKNGALIEQVLEESDNTHEESETAGILYFTRHYRMLPGKSEPSRTENPPATGDLGFLKFGVFPGDSGCFSITMCTPEIEYEMRKAIVRPEIFHQITLMLPGLRPWTNDEQAEPTSKVYGMGDLHSRWRDLTVDNKPAARGYFALGDTLIRTNPLYGRGCSFAAVSAQLIQKVLDATPDPNTRAIDYHAMVHAELKPYYLVQRTQDRSAMRRAKRELTPGATPSWRAKMIESFLKDGVTIALRYETDLLRQALRGFHMLEHPNKWLKKPSNLARVLYYWARGKKRNAVAYPPNPGPRRSEMMRALHLDDEKDLLATKRAADRPDATQASGENKQAA